MIDKLIKNKISELAYAKYCERRDKGLPGDDVTDWLTAEVELCDRRQNKNCPLCHYPIFKKDGLMVCCRCEWTIDKKRSTDEHLPDADNIRKDFNG